MLNRFLIVQEKFKKKYCNKYLTNFKQSEISTCKNSGKYAIKILTSCLFYSLFLHFSKDNDNKFKSLSSFCK